MGGSEKDLGMAEITPEESFLIQSLALAECCYNLGVLEANKDPIIFDNTDRIFGQTARGMAKLGKSIFGGQGTLISFFYMFLVLPLEWKRKKIGDFDQLDLSDAERVATDTAIVREDSYKNRDQALRHFRNALAHGRIGWKNGNLVVEDRDLKECIYVAEYSTENLGRLAQSLNMAITNYLGSVMKARETRG